MSDRALIGTRKGLFVLNAHGGGRWGAELVGFAGAPVTQVLHDPRDGSWYVCLDHGHFGVKLHRSDDGGQAWQEIAAPAYPQRPVNVPPVISPMTGREIEWKLVMAWELAVDHAAQGALWCGTIPGGLFHSDDRGQSWRLVRSLWDRPERANWMGGGFDEPGIHSVLTHPDRPDHLVVGVSCGGVWFSEDHGQTWALKTHGMRAAYMPPDQEFEGDFQDPHILAASAADPDTIWAQHHNGIFVTRDGGGRWVEIGDAGPSTFGFAAACHPRDGNTAWFVPAQKDEVRIPVDGRFVVTRTRDGGDHFDVLTDGLPQGDAYDIVFRHALSVDSTGDALAMGSTTGSVWASTDQGDTWQHVTAHLPPVYTVRWV